MNSFFTALYNLFSNPIVVGVVSAYEAGEHVVDVVHVLVHITIGNMITLQ